MPQLDEELKYIFGFLSDPARIEFDDEILKSMKIMISKSGEVSDTMKVLFPYLKHTQEKHRFVYSELFDLIKAYCKNDKEFVFSDPQNILNLFGYGVSTIFNTDHTPNGAVYLIQLFLILKNDNPEYTESVVEDVLTKVVERIGEKPMNRVLKRILFGVILASMVSNYRATFSFLENQNLTDFVMESVLKFSVKKMDNLLERRLYAMALTSLLTQQELPDIVRDKSPRIITKIVDILVRTSIDEAKRVRKKEKKKIDFKQEEEFGSDDSDFESSESDYSDEESDEDKENRANVPNPASIGIGEENKDQYDMDNDNVSTDSNEGDEILESEIDVQSNFAIMKTGLNSFDEFNYFKHVISELYKNHSQQMDMLISQLSDRCQKALKGLIQIKKFENKNGIVHRRVIQARRKR